MSTTVGGHQSTLTSKEMQADLPNTKRTAVREGLGMSTAEFVDRQPIVLLGWRLHREVATIGVTPGSAMIPNRGAPDLIASVM